MNHFVENTNDTDKLGDNLAFQYIACLIHNFKIKKLHVWELNFNYQPFKNGFRCERERLIRISIFSDIYKTFLLIFQLQLPQLSAVLWFEENIIFFLTHPYDGVQLGHGNLFRSLNSCRHLLLVFLGEKRKDLCYNSVQSLRYFSLKQTKTSYNDLC